jgi:alpha-1,2-mannosyltransferase
LNTIDPVRKQQLAFRILLAAALILAVAAILVPAGRGWDFANFYDTGRRAISGQLADIYNSNSLIAGQAPQGKMAFWGAPISAWLYAPLGLFPPGVALIVLKLAGTLAYAAGLILLFRGFRATAERNGADAGWFLVAFTGLVVLFQPFWTVYRVGGQTTPFVFLLLVLGLRAYLRQQMLAVATAMLFITLMKPAFVFVPLFLLFFSGRRYALALAGVFAITGVISLALFGIELHREFLSILQRGSAKPSPWPFNSAIYIIADAFRPIANQVPVPRAGGWFPDALRIGLKVTVLATFIRLLARSRRQPWLPTQRRMFNYLAAIAFCLLISQVVWEHYLAVLFIPLIFLVAGYHRLERPVRLHLGAIFALSLLQNLILVLLFRDHVPVTSTPVLLLVSLVKAGPLLGLLLFFWFHQSAFYGLIGTVPAREVESSHRAAPLAAGAVA